MKKLIMALSSIAPLVVSFIGIFGMSVGYEYVNGKTDEALRILLAGFGLFLICLAVSFLNANE
jgi:xanthosine utilization system XapX-like protein